MVAGGFQGEFICKFLNRPGVAFCTKLTAEDNANTSISPNGNMIAVLGDSSECLIADAQSGKVIDTLKGHLDFSFSPAWHPNGQILATGNQDTTCRLWDARNMSKSFAVLKGRMGAIRAIKFTSDGRYMAMVEGTDFVHIFDSQSDYGSSQEIDLFGEIVGISFSPDTEALFTEHTEVFWSSTGGVTITT